MSDLHEVQTGDVITAAAFNAIIARLAELDRPQETLPKTFARNDTGADVPQYGVMGIGGPTATYTPGTTAGSNRWKLHWQLNIVGETPDPDTHKGKWCVALGRIKSGKPGEVKASGMVQVRVYVNGADDAYCDVDAGHTDGDYTCYLGTGASGAQILWRENAGSGEGTVVWALVRLGNNPIPQALLIRGLATAAVDEEDATFTIDNIEIMAPAGGLVTDQTHPTGPTDTMTIYNRPALAMDEDAVVFAEWNDETGHWEWRAPYDTVPSLLFYNASGEEVPARAVMAVSGGGAQDGEHYVSIEKPSSTFRKQFVINGATAVAAAGWGRCYDVGHRRVLYDTGTPAVGELWGPKSGQWTLSKTMTARGDWGVIVAGIYDGTGKILNGKPTDQGMARLCTGQLYAALATTDSTVVVDTIVAIDGGWPPVLAGASPPDDQITVYNTRKFEGDNDAKCKIYYNVATGHWEFDDIECPA